MLSGNAVDLSVYGPFELHQLGQLGAFAAGVVAEHVFFAVDALQHVSGDFVWHIGEPAGLENNQVPSGYGPVRGLPNQTGNWCPALAVGALGIAGLFLRHHAPGAALVHQAVSPNGQCGVRLVTGLEPGFVTVAAAVPVHALVPCFMTRLEVVLLCWVVGVSHGLLGKAGNGFSCFFQAQARALL